jgi:hypothetical protein
LLPGSHGASLGAQVGLITSLTSDFRRDIHSPNKYPRKQRQVSEEREAWSVIFPATHLLDTEKEAALRCGFVCHCVDFRKELGIDFPK